MVVPPRCRAHRCGALQSDQSFNYCPTCGHGQLGRVLDPVFLYGDTYAFRTSGSATARTGVERFAGYVESLVRGRRFGTVVDFGCNDACLLRRLRTLGRVLVGVDPIWSERGEMFASEGIRMLGARIEDVDLAQACNGAPDLVVSQHTLEHIGDPGGVLKHLSRAADASTLFVFEFPCLELLLEQWRFDRIFHQHLQYFTLHSFLRLLDRVGGELVDVAFNPCYWGAVWVAFRLRRGRRPLHSHIPKTVVPSVAEILRRYGVFREHFAAVGALIRDADERRLYGYGASLTLPILAYHLQTDMGQFRAILDDDSCKDGWRYANLPVRVWRADRVDLEDASVVVTAPDHQRAILGKLIDRRPRHILSLTAISW